jgi:hypothetical protein
MTSRSTSGRDDLRARGGGCNGIALPLGLYEDLVGSGGVSYIHWL